MLEPKNKKIKHLKTCSNLVGLDKDRVLFRLAERCRDPAAERSRVINLHGAAGIPFGVMQVGDCDHDEEYGNADSCENIKYGRHLVIDESYDPDSQDSSPKDCKDFSPAAIASSISALHFILQKN